MATVTYLTSATNQTYSSSALTYIENLSEDIKETAAALGVPLITGHASSRGAAFSRDVAIQY